MQLRTNENDGCVAITTGEHTDVAKAIDVEYRTINSKAAKMARQNDVGVLFFLGM